MKKNLLIASFIALFSLLVFWAPFLFRVESFWGIDFSSSGMEVIVSNFDGLNFLVVERTWYNPELINQFNQSFLTGNEPVYFTAHYPGYALLISLFDQFLSGPQSLMASVVASNVILASALYMFFYHVVSKKHALWLSAIALFLPARMLSVRAVGSTEPLFISLVLLSLTSHVRGKNWLSSILGSLAVLTRGPGILLFGAYGIYYLMRKPFDIKKLLQNITPYLLMPLTLLGLWGFYGQRFGSFLAYFQSGDNIHLFFPPFQVFSNMTSWVSGMWLEDVIYIYLLFAIGISLFYKSVSKKNRASSLFPWVYMATVFFVAHRDIARYSLPAAPFVLAGFSKYMTKPWVKWILVIAIIPVYLVGWNFVLQNVQPVNDWSAFL